MKKFFFAVAALVLPCVLVSNTFAADREHTLKVYNWADYIDMNVLNGFPAWYYEQTGERVEVLYQTFDINESMLTEIEVGQEDYDVICPSEYIIESGSLIPSRVSSACRYRTAGRQPQSER